MLNNRLIKAVVYVETTGGKYTAHREFSSLGLECLKEALDELEALSKKGVRAYVSNFDSGSGFYPHAYNVVSV